MPQSTKEKKKQKKKSHLYVGKEIYGTLPKEEVFRKALEPYFNELQSDTISKINRRR